MLSTEYDDENGAGLSRQHQYGNNSILTSTSAHDDDKVPDDDGADTEPGDDTEPDVNTESEALLQELAEQFRASVNRDTERAYANVPAPPALAPGSPGPEVRSTPSPPPPPASTPLVSLTQASVSCSSASGSTKHENIVSWRNSCASSSHVNQSSGYVPSDSTLNVPQSQSSFASNAPGTGSFSSLQNSSSNPFSETAAHYQDGLGNNTQVSAFSSFQASGSANSSAISAWSGNGSVPTSGSFNNININMSATIDNTNSTNFALNGSNPLLNSDTWWKPHNPATFPPNAPDPWAGTISRNSSVTVPLNFGGCNQSVSAAPVFLGLYHGGSNPSSQASSSQFNANASGQYALTRHSLSFAQPNLDVEMGDDTENDTDDALEISMSIYDPPGGVHAVSGVQIFFPDEGVNPSQELEPSQPVSVVVEVAKIESPVPFPVPIRQCSESPIAECSSLLLGAQMDWAQDNDTLPAAENSSAVGFMFAGMATLSPTTIQDPLLSLTASQTAFSHTKKRHRDLDELDQPMLKRHKGLDRIRVCNVDPRKRLIKFNGNKTCFVPRQSRGLMSRSTRRLACATGRLSFQIALTPD